MLNRQTLDSQRKLLFQIWEQIGDLQRALSESRVSERSFYYWKPRFEEGGYEALEHFASHAPKHPNCIDEGNGF